ncbi:hypothetical protein vseg_015127 [Gypsophila vaccaria]
MARKSNAQRHRELNLRGRTIRPKEMTDTMEAENRGDTHSSRSKPTTPSGDIRGKVKNIHDIIGIPELELESDAEEEEGEIAEATQKQSMKEQNRA